jgi:heme/copper-type cytochrome/quinol oxidase subunit 2
MREKNHHDVTKIYDDDVMRKIEDHDMMREIEDHDIMRKINDRQQIRKMNIFLTLLLISTILASAGCTPRLEIPEQEDTRLDMPDIKDLDMPEIKNQFSTELSQNNITEMRLPEPFKKQFEQGSEGRDKARAQDSSQAMQQKDADPTSHSFGNTAYYSINVYRYAFEPNEIRVTYGKNVTITIQSMDVRHGIAIPDLGINEPIPAEGLTRISFESTKKGEFKFFSSVYSGEGYKNMTGKIIVE